MKVSELIERLQRKPPTSDVIIDMECGCFPVDAGSVHLAEDYGEHTGIKNGEDVVITPLK